MKRSLKIFLLVAAAFLLMKSPQAQFSIGPGGWVTVTPGASLHIGSDLHITSTAAGSGYLVDQNAAGEIDIIGDVTVQRYLTANEWHNTGIPVSNATTSVYAGTDLIFYYDETLILNDWNFGWVMMYPSALVPFRGYDVYFATSPVTVSYTATGTETLNTGTYTFGITLTNSTPGEIPSHKGWNLAGNPYPSPVDWMAASGWDKSDINDAKYIWDGANDIYTIYVGGASPVGLNGGTRFIPSNQGFWVQAIANGNIGIGNATRVGNITGTPDYYKDAPIDYPMLSLLASGDSGDDEVMLRFIAGTTAGFDINWDAMKLYSMNPDVPQLSLASGSQVFALNTLPEITEDLVVPLFFQSAAEGTYSISVSSRTTLDPSVHLYLKDALDKKTVNLADDSTYTFFHHPANERERFSLLFNPSDDLLNDITPANYFTVYATGNMVVIQKNTTKDIQGEIRVIDLTGRPVLGKNLDNGRKQAFSANLATGYYIVSIITAEGVSNTKIFITSKY